jgi:hypothetical protein
MISETDKACAAGWLDGEGCVYIGSQLKTNSNQPYYRLTVSVVNTDKRIMNWFQERWGGYIVRQQRGRKHIVYRWYREQIKAGYFLRDILPYLIIKREQAELALAFLDHQEETKYSRNDVAAEIRELYKQGLHTLKTAYLNPCA